jgi:NRAMP (natural resistance-associated macrophage protein)-like metal ion transporter
MGAASSARVAAAAAAPSPPPPPQRPAARGLADGEPSDRLASASDRLAGAGDRLAGEPSAHDLLLLDPAPPAGFSSDDSGDEEAARAPPSRLRLGRFLAHFGPAILMSIAYVDPGNLEADLQAGAGEGYALLWLLAASTAAGGLLQSLAARLGAATGADLAAHCAARYPSAAARLPLWLMTEAAIVGADIQEVIGAALALSLLTAGAFPLWAGCIAAAGLSFALLLLERLGARWLEALFHFFVAALAVTMGALFFVAGAPLEDVASGLLIPRLPKGALPTAAALVGAALMPHNLFLHSALVAPARGGGAGGARVGRREKIRYHNLESAAALAVTLLINVAVVSVFAAGFHAAASSSSKGGGGTGGVEIGLVDAGRLLSEKYGRSPALVWACGLLAAGLSATCTGTFAGQHVAVGFLRLRSISPLKRALATRAVALGPTLLAAARAGVHPASLDALSQWINVLQAIQLPFALVPLLVLTSDPAVMGARFANGRGTAAAAWAIAAAVAAVNVGTVVAVAAERLPAAPLARGACGVVAAAYVGAVAYLAWWEPRATRRRRAAAAATALREPLLAGAPG